MSLIYLVGPRACGKTTLGKALSEVLDVPYCDTDHHLCERLGMDVATMVERWGWEGFRSRESESLRLASEELAGRGVVATGGGMPNAGAWVAHQSQWPMAMSGLRGAVGLPPGLAARLAARAWAPACPTTPTPAPTFTHAMPVTVHTSTMPAWACRCR